MLPRAAAVALLAWANWLLWAGTGPRVQRADARPAVVAVPRTVGAWEGTPLAVDPRAFQLLETPDVALMEYRTGQEPPVWLAQVAGFGTRAAFHPPELCYVGSHFEVLARVPIVLEAAGARRRVMRLVVAQGNERFEAWYWFTANGRVTPSYYRQQLWLVADTIRRRPVSGMLLRISTPIDDPTRTHQRLQTFVDAFLRAHGGFSSPIDA